MDAIFKLEDHDTFHLAVKDLLKLNHASSFSNAEITSSMVESAKEDLRKSLYKANYDINETCKQILNNSSWNQDRAKEFVSLLKKCKTELFQSIVTHHNSVFGDTVTDIIWSLKLILGTSELKVLRYPLMQLVLSSVNSNGQTKQKLYEFNKDTLLSLIKKLENCVESEDL